MSAVCFYSDVLMISVRILCKLWNLVCHI